MPNGSAVCLVHRRRRGWACFRARRYRASPFDRPPSVPAWFQPSTSSRLLRAPSPPTPPAAFRRGPPTRVRALLATSPARVHSLPRGFQPSLRSVLRRSQPLDGFLRAPAPRLVSSSSRVQGALRSGCSPSAQQERFVTAQCPLAFRRHPARRATSRSARPRDVASASRPCSTRRCVRSGSGISLPGRRSPLRIRLLQALHLSGRRRLTRRPPLMAFSRFGLRSRARRDPPPSACCPREARWFCLQTHPPARAFGPAVWILSNPSGEAPCPSCLLRPASVESRPGRDVTDGSESRRL